MSTDVHVVPPSIPRPAPQPHVTPLGPPTCPLLQSSPALLPPSVHFCLAHFPPLSNFPSPQLPHKCHALAPIPSAPSIPLSPSHAPSGSDLPLSSSFPEIRQFRSQAAVDAPKVFLRWGIKAVKGRDESHPGLRQHVQPLAPPPPLPFLAPSLFLPPSPFSVPAKCKARRQGAASTQLPIPWGVRGNLVTGSTSKEEGCPAEGWPACSMDMRADITDDSHDPFVTSRAAEGRVGREGVVHSVGGMRRRYGTNSRS